jgi:hypothetical protein
VNCDATNEVVRTIVFIVALQKLKSNKFTSSAARDIGLLESEPCRRLRRFGIRGFHSIWAFYRLPGAFWTAIFVAELNLLAKE